MKKLILSLAAVAASVLVADGRKPVFLNVDDTHFYQSRGRLGIDIGEREIREMVSKYRGTDVTDLVLCERRDVRYYITPEKPLDLSYMDEAIAKPRTVAASATSAGQRVGCYRAGRGGRDGTVEGFAITSDVIVR